MGAVIICVAACGFDRRAPALDAPGSAPPDTAADLDAPPAACPATPAGCAAFGCAGSTSCYYLCTAGRGWVESNMACMTAGVGCLVTIDDAAENTCVVGAAASNLPAWIGYVQTDTTIEPATGWTWACRSSRFTAPPWATTGNEPNDTGGDEDCATLVSALGSWNDATCTDVHAFVCELPR